MCPSAFSILGPPGPGEEEGVQTCTKTFLGQVGICVQNFIKIGAGVWNYIYTIMDLPYLVLYRAILLLNHDGAVDGNKQTNNYVLF